MPERRALGNFEVQVRRRVLACGLHAALKTRERPTDCPSARPESCVWWCPYVFVLLERRFAEIQGHVPALLLVHSAEEGGGNLQTAHFSQRGFGRSEDGVPQRGRERRLRGLLLLLLHAEVQGTVLIHLDGRVLEEEQMARGLRPGHSPRTRYPCTPVRGWTFGGFCPPSLEASLMCVCVFYKAHSSSLTYLFIRLFIYSYLFLAGTSLFSCNVGCCFFLFQ